MISKDLSWEVETINQTLGYQMSVFGHFGLWMKMPLWIKFAASSESHPLHNRKKWKHNAAESSYIITVDAITTGTPNHPNQPMLWTAQPLVKYLLNTMYLLIAWNTTGRCKLIGLWTRSLIALRPLPITSHLPRESSHWTSVRLFVLFTKKRISFTISVNGERYYHQPIATNRTFDDCSTRHIDQLMRDNWSDHFFHFHNWYIFVEHINWQKIVNNKYILILLSSHK